MRVAVYGASGDAGGFVVAELVRRGHVPVAVGRDRSKLAAFAAPIEQRVASTDDPASLDGALCGVRALINCAGPFLDTAQPLIQAALRSGIHYLDVTAEQESARSTFASFDADARRRDVVILPAVGFFGALGDLSATAAMKDWMRADRIDVAIALNGWWPTVGTRNTGARNAAPRLVLARGNLEPLTSSASAPWMFAGPFETQDVLEVPLSETILISKHLNVHEMHNYINQAPLRDSSDPATPVPIVADERGRSEQTFILDAIARKGTETRRVRVRGRDIYAATAAIVVEAAEWVCEGGAWAGGTYAVGGLLDATAFLVSLDLRGDLSFQRDLSQRID